MELFTPKNSSLIGIFSEEENNRYLIPRFQRDYEWGKEQIENFWSDLESVKAGSRENLFFGNFIFLKSDDKKSFYVIDGQQRMTTVQLLLIALRTRAKALNDDALQIANINNLIEYVANKFAKQSRTELKRLMVSKTIQPLFNVVSDFQWDGVIPEKLGGLDGRTYRKIKGKIEPIYNFFYEKIKDKNTQELADILLALQHVFVTKIEIDDPQDAFDIFERTNARGIKLAQADLVKNLLFQNTEEDLHDEIENNWESIISNSNDNLSQMLKYYVVTFNGATRRKDIFSILSKKAKNSSIREIIDSLSNFSLFYKMMITEGTTSSEISAMGMYFREIIFMDAINNGTHRKTISRIISAFQLFNITQVYPIIFSYIQSLKKFSDEINGEKKANPNKKLKTAGEYLVNFLKRLEAFHFVNTVIGDNIGNQVEALYADYAKHIFEAESFLEFIDLENSLKSELIRLRDSRKTFIAKFTDLNCEDVEKRLMYYIFDRISNAESKGDQIYPLYNPDKDVQNKTSNLEHFYPKRLFETTGDLIGIDFGNNVGNLLVIPKHTNSVFSDSLPKEKYKIIKSDPKYLINICNRDLIIMRYENCKWDRETIEKRSLDLAQYSFDTVWNINQ